MSTSANVIEYRIMTLDDKNVGLHRQHLLCKEHWEDLLKFQPLENHTIQAYGYDEEDEYWESEDIHNLKEFLDKKAKHNKTLKELLYNK